MRWEDSLYHQSKAPPLVECINKVTDVAGHYLAALDFKKCPILNCKKCPSDSPSKTCEACQDPTAPSTAWFVDKTTTPNRCIQDCPKAEYKFVDDKNHCVNCPQIDNCKECDKLGCSLCNDGFVLKKGLRDCVVCNGIGEFINANNECEKCPQYCSQCDLNGCSACLQGYVFALNSDVCTECTDKGKFINDQNRCDDCKENCDRCQDKQGCSECSDGFNLLLTKDGQVTDSCVRCDQKEQFPNNKNQCQSCPEGCVDCEGVEVCKECQTDYYLLEGSSPNICVDRCDEAAGRIAMEASGRLVCKSCPKGCKVCKSQEKCDLCYTTEEGPLFLQPDEKGCLASCPKGFFKHEKSQMCRECPKECE